MVAITKPIQEPKKGLLRSNLEYLSNKVRMGREGKERREGKGKKGKKKKILREKEDSFNFK